jgi:hypothetical protein
VQLLGDCGTVCKLRVFRPERSDNQQLYPSTDGPRYVKGHAISIGLLGYGLFIYSFLSYYYNRVNKRREAGEEDYKIEGMTEAEIDALGDESPRFKYTI